MTIAEPLRRLRRRGRLARHGLRSNEPSLIFLCAPLGAFVGFVVIGLHQFVTWLRVVVYDLPTGASLSASPNIDPLRLVLALTVGGLVMGLARVAWKRLRPMEVVDPIEANAIFGGRMSVIDTARLTLDTVISNAAGASLGMEAAYSQVGSGLLSSVGQWLNLRRADLRVFVAAGAAAAIAAAFNAPLAGAFYAYELVLGGYNAAALAQVATAAVAGALVTRATLGVAPIFLVQAGAVSVYQWDYLFFALMGMAAGGLGIMTMRAATFCEQTMRSLPVPPVLRPAIGGAILFVIALAFPQVLGSGHGAIGALFHREPTLLPVVLLLLAKMAASAISIGTGFRGGLFSSSLYLGCLFGACMANLLGLVQPALLDRQMIFILVGMGAVAASVVGAPVTVAFLVLEVTGDFDVALCVLAGVITASALTRYTFGYSFSTWRFHQQGKPIRGAHDIGWIKDLTVERVMRRDIRTVREDMPLRTLREQVPLGSCSRVFAIDEDGGFAGVIDVAVIHDPGVDVAAEGLLAIDLTGDSRVYLLPQMNIRTALQLFEDLETEVMPVLASATDRRVIGYVTEAFALRRYTRELERQRSAELGQRDLFSVDPVDTAATPVSTRRNRARSKRIAKVRQQL